MRSFVHSRNLRWTPTRRAPWSCATTSCAGTSSTCTNLSAGPSGTSRISSTVSSAPRVELDVECDRAAHHEHLHPLVLELGGEPHRRDAVEHRVQHVSAFEPRERCTHAEVYAPAESELALHDLAPVEVELLWALEHRFVVVGR